MKCIYFLFCFFPITWMFFLSCNFVLPIILYFVTFGMTRAHTHTHVFVPHIVVSSLIVIESEQGGCLVCTCMFQCQKWFHSTGRTRDPSASSQWQFPRVSVPRLKDIAKHYVELGSFWNRLAIFPINRYNAASVRAQDIGKLPKLRDRSEMLAKSMIRPSR